MRDGILVRDTGDTLTLTDSRASAVALAGHVHEDLDLSGFHIIPGIRGEGIQTQRDDTDVGTVVRTIALPGLGLLYEITDGFDVFAGAHRGFSPVPPGEPVEVKPETSWNVEGGLRLGRGAPQIEAVGYLNDYVNITGQCTLSGGCLDDDLDRQFNGGSALVYGAEGTARHEVLLPLKLSLPMEAAYTWTRSFFRTGFVSGFPQFGRVEPGYFLPYVPQHQGSARLSVAHPRARIGAAVNARSGMLDAAGPLPVPEDIGVPPLLTVDVGRRCRLQPGGAGLRHRHQRHPEHRAGLVAPVRRPAHRTAADHRRDQGRARRPLKGPPAGDKDRPEVEMGWLVALLAGCGGLEGQADGWLEIEGRAERFDGAALTIEDAIGQRFLVVATRNRGLDCEWVADQLLPSDYDYPEPKSGRLLTAWWLETAPEEVYVIEERRAPLGLGGGEVGLVALLAGGVTFDDPEETVGVLHTEAGDVDFHAIDCGAL